jgi:coenzyme F420-0:L-glutamate ligase / coenzyme F420-1:gamma-L-glutamate ligase
MTLTLTPVPGIPIIGPGDDLPGIIMTCLNQANIELEDNDILVIAQKIVSKAEGRYVNFKEIVPSKAAQELALQSNKDPRVVELILRESKEVLRVRQGSIIVEHKLGFVCASAGIDHSNVNNQGGEPEDWVLLLPENPDQSAHEMRIAIKDQLNLNIGILIIDSHGRAWRLGTVGVAIGISGIPGLVDLRGDADLFGYKLQITTVGAADELAAAASLVMGQANEGTPVIHVRGFPYPLREGNLRELIRPKEQDMFR